MRLTTFLFMQFAVAVFVAVVILNEPNLKNGLVGDPTGLPDWIKLRNLKVEFI